MSDQRGNAIPYNRILQRLSNVDRDLLTPLLEPVDLPIRKVLEAPHRRIDHVFFIERGFASVVANGRPQRSIEVGLIGREGVTGLAVMMRTDRSPNATFMQYAGSGQRIAVTDLKQALRESDTLYSTLLNFGHAFHIQTTQTALANGRSKIEQRLARWLCMAHDRIDGNDLALTHEFIAVMLGVRRPGVTLMLEALERVGLIRRHRGIISILDRKGLEKSSDGTYGLPEAEFQRMFG